MNKKLNNQGVTLIELLAVIIIIGIIAVIAVPIYNNYIENAEKGVCHTNTFELERMYELELLMDGTTHSDTKFTTYLQEYGSDLCPDEGITSYIEDQFRCSIHGSHSHNQDEPIHDDKNEDDSGNDVPFL